MTEDETSRHGKSQPGRPEPGTAERRRASGPRADPLGKRALFGSDATPTEPDVVEDPFAPAAARGRRALFSEEAVDRGDAPSARGVAVLVCRRCGTSTSLGVIGLVTGLVPSLWIPGRRWSHWVRCPACDRLSWCRLKRP